MKRRNIWAVIIGFSCLFLAACDSDHQNVHDASEHAHGANAAEDHEHDEHEHEDGAARFVEGKGLALSEESREALGLTFSAAEHRRISSVVPVEAQVYRAATEPSRQSGETGGSAYATAFLPPQAVKSVELGDGATLAGSAGSFSGSVWKVEATSRDALANEEVILAIPDAAGSLKVGDFLSGVITKPSSETDVLSIPLSAVLETAGGGFVFVKNDEFLLRKAVRTGSASADWIEIAEGLRDGDTVVTHPVETLYLIELRATKGGGHSH